jgi:hypothetical protein
MADSILRALFYPAAIIFVTGLVVILWPLISALVSALITSWYPILVFLAGYIVCLACHYTYTHRAVRKLNARLTAIRRLTDYRLNQLHKDVKAQVLEAMREMGDKAITEEYYDEKLKLLKEKDPEAFQAITCQEQIQKICHLAGAVNFEVDDVRRMEAQLHEARKRERELQKTEQWLEQRRREAGS